MGKIVYNVFTRYVPLFFSGGGGEATWHNFRDVELKFCIFS